MFHYDMCSSFHFQQSICKLRVYDYREIEGACVLSEKAVGVFLHVLLRANSVLSFFLFIFRAFVLSFSSLS